MRAAKVYITLGAVVLATAVVAGALITGLGRANAATSNVAITDFAFTPATVTINVGDTVTWTNNSATTTHTVTSNTAAFDSGNIAPGGTFSQVFNTAGTFAYHCTIHPTMTGTVVVSAGTATSTATATNTATATTSATSTSTATATATTTTTATATASPTATATATRTATLAPTATATTAAASPSASAVVPSAPNTGNGRTGAASGGDIGLYVLVGSLLSGIALAAGGASLAHRSRR